MGTVIPTPTSFNMQVFKILNPIIHGGKIFPHSYPVVVSAETDFLAIPKPNGNGAFGLGDNLGSSKMHDQ